MNKEIKIIPPEGYEIDKKNSTSECIKFKEVSKLPLSVKEIKGRRWFINTVGDINGTGLVPYNKNLNNVSSESRAKAFLALMQLIELRDAWNGDWEHIIDKTAYTINVASNKIVCSFTNNVQFILMFKTGALRDDFYHEFKDLIEEAKELL